MKINHNVPSLGQKKRKKVVPHFAHDKTVVSIKDSYYITEVTDQVVSGAHNCNGRLLPDQLDEALVEVICYTSTLLQSETKDLKNILNSSSDKYGLLGSCSLLNHLGYSDAKFSKVNFSNKHLIELYRDKKLVAAVVKLGRFILTQTKSGSEGDCSQRKPKWAFVHTDDITDVKVKKQAEAEREAQLADGTFLTDGTFFDKGRDGKIGIKHAT